MSDPTRQVRERFFATPEEYLAFEEEAEEKHEWWDGEVIAMPGTSDRHGIVNANVIIGIGKHLTSGPCRLRTGDVRVRSPLIRQQSGQRGLYTYPDATIVCGDANFDRGVKGSDTITNPTLLVEVLSPSTEKADRGAKFQRYQTIETFREYVLVSQDQPLVQVFLRRDNGDWKITHTRGLDAIARLDSINVDLPLAELYAGTDMPEGNNVAQ